MKAITLHQPWASLIAHGVKTIETRSWRPPRSLYRQRIAIHAGKRVFRPSSLDPEIHDAVARLYGERWWEAVPRGAVVATVVLDYAEQVHRWKGDHVTLVGDWRRREIPTDAFGDFSPGRWLWFLKDIEPVEPPIAAVGHQSLWEWVQEERPWLTVTGTEARRCAG